ncbi:hypothetical protein L1887_61375 [Cichorium endivia]|nr:hypothetical protein L1887_61375 [Cichorium endivia]
MVETQSSTRTMFGYHPVWIIDTIQIWLTNDLSLSTALASKSEMRRISASRIKSLDLLDSLDPSANWRTSRLAEGIPNANATTKVNRRESPATEWPAKHPQCAAKLIIILSFACFALLAPHFDRSLESLPSAGLESVRSCESHKSFFYDAGLDLNALPDYRVYWPIRSFRSDEKRHKNALSNKRTDLADLLLRCCRHSTSQVGSLFGLQTFVTYPEQHKLGDESPSVLRCIIQPCCQAMPDNYLLDKRDNCNSISPELGLLTWKELDN